MAIPVVQYCKTKCRCILAYGIQWCSCYLLYHGFNIYTGMCASTDKCTVLVQAKVVMFDKTQMRCRPKKHTWARQNRFVVCSKTVKKIIVKGRQEPVCVESAKTAPSYQCGIATACHQASLSSRSPTVTHDVTRWLLYAIWPYHTNSHRSVCNASTGTRVRACLQLAACNAYFLPAALAACSAFTLVIKPCTTAGSARVLTSPSCAAKQAYETKRNETNQR